MTEDSITITAIRSTQVKDQRNSVPEESFSSAFWMKYDYIEGYIGIQKLSNTWVRGKIVNEPMHSLVNLCRTKSTQHIELKFHSRSNRVMLFHYSELIFFVARSQLEFLIC